jgi:NAD(P)-dependent dehydrogenase (short-subunit alcohol dehydrogenase family)
LAKGGLHAVTRALAIEYAGKGIRINTVALGAIETPMHKIEAHDFLKSLQPIGRMGKIDEVVGAVMYLNDAKFVTGEVLHVDGGAHAGKWYLEKCTYERETFSFTPSISSKSV